MAPRVDLLKVVAEQLRLPGVEWWQIGRDSESLAAKLSWQIQVRLRVIQARCDQERNIMIQATFGIALHGGNCQLARENRRHSVWAACGEVLMDRTSTLEKVRVGGYIHVSVSPSSVGGTYLWYLMWLAANDATYVIPTCSRIDHLPAMFVLH